MMKKSIHYFLYRIASLDDLPADVATLIHHQTGDQTIENLILIPPQDYAVTPQGWRLSLPFLWRRTPERTVAFTPTRIVVVEAEADRRLTTITIPLDCLVGINLTVVLLYAFFELTWLEGQGAQTLRIEFNAVGEHIVRQALERVRARTSPPIADLAPNPDAWAGLAEAPIKFRSYLRYHLAPDETVALAVYQPSIKRGEGWFQPTLGPNRALALTDRELLLLEDPRDRLTTRYGLAVRFYPLRRLWGMTWHESPNAIWLHLAFDDHAGVEVRVPLSASLAARVKPALAAAAPSRHGEPG